MDDEREWWKLQADTIDTVMAIAPSERRDWVKSTWMGRYAFDRERLQSQEARALAPLVSAAASYASNEDGYESWLQAQRHSLEQLLQSRSRG